MFKKPCAMILIRQAWNGGSSAAELAAWSGRSVSTVRRYLLTTGLTSLRRAGAVLSLALALTLDCSAAGMLYTPVLDDVDMLRPETAAEITRIGNRLNGEGRCQFVVRVVATCDDTLMDGRKFFNAAGIGDKEKNNGLLLFINALNFKSGQPNRVRLLTGYGLEGLFNDAKCGRILDAGLAMVGVDEQVLTMVRGVDAEFKALGDKPVPAKTAEKRLPLWMQIILVIVLLVILPVVIAALGSPGDYYGESGGSGGYGGFGGGFGGGGGGSCGGGSCGGGGAGR